MRTKNLKKHWAITPTNCWSIFLLIVSIGQLTKGDAQALQTFPTTEPSSVDTTFSEPSELEPENAESFSTISRLSGSSVLGSTPSASSTLRFTSSKPFTVSSTSYGPFRLTSTTPNPFSLPSTPSELTTSRPTASEPSPCTLSWQEELIACHGINHNQLVEALGRIKRQIEQDKQVAEGRQLESDGREGGTPRVLLEKTSNKSSLDPIRSRRTSGVRELNIFDCDIPKLTSSTVYAPSELSILSVVHSDVKEVRPDAFEDHAQSLTRLSLIHNHLEALPDALRNLTKLEVLDLSHNDIDHLPEGSLLFNLFRLRHLHLDHNKLGQILGAQARLGLQSPGLSLAVFNLEPLRESLTHLTLANNDIAAFPEQFSRPFVRLSELDLSSNAISEVLSDGFQEMPQLRSLDLSDNLLEGLSIDRFSNSVLDINLRGNPWNCDCDSKWILDTVQNKTDSLSITPPTCSFPLRLRHQDISSLRDSDICPVEKAMRSRVVYVGDDVDGPLKLALKSLHLLNVTVLNHQGLIISWRVDGDFYTSQGDSPESLSWAVTLHKTKEDSRLAKVTQMKLERYKAERTDWRPTESLYTELLYGLESEEQYTLCLVPVQDDYLFTRPDQCHHVTTPKELITSTPLPPPPSPPPTTTTSTSTTTTTVSKPSSERFPISTKDYEVQTERVVLLNEARKVHMSWNVTIHLYDHSNTFVKRNAVMLQPLGWKITYRRFAEENETEIVLVSQGGEPVQNFTNHYTVDDLLPGTGYTFCFRPLSDDEVEASLKDNRRESHSISSSLNSKSHRDPEVIFSMTKDRHQQQSNINQAVTNLVEEDYVPSIDTNNFLQPELPTEPSYPDYEFSDFPSNIPPLPNYPPEGISAVIPEIPNFNVPAFPFDRRPPPPPPPPSEGNFVYTSTGERIPIPSLSSGPASPFNLPSVVGPAINFNPTQSQWSSSSHPILNIPTRPQSQFTENSSGQVFAEDDTIETNATTKEPHAFSHMTRQKRSVKTESKVTYEKYLGPGSVEFCKEVVTLEENSIIMPVAVASTVSSSTTVIIAIVFCCCCPKVCRRKKSGLQGKSSSNKRKISTISDPTPINVYTRQISAVSGTTTVEDNSSDVKSTSSHVLANGTTFVDGDMNNHQLQNGHAVSATTSNGYLTPLPTSNGGVPDSVRVFNEAKQYLPSQKAYLSSLKDHLNQQNRELKDFHPGYDIPPTSSIKALLGYDYPHPTPVNPIGSHSESADKPAIPSKPPIPSPSSSDSNYNASVSDPQEVDSLRSKVNLNIPFNQNKSSDTNKKFNLAKGADCNYITPEDVNSRQRSYIKNPPSKIRHRKFGSPQRLPDESTVPAANGYQDLMISHYAEKPLQTPSQLSRSVPDLATAAKSSESSNEAILRSPDMTAAARLNLLIGSQARERDHGASSLPPLYSEGSTPKRPTSSTSSEPLQDVDEYTNYPPPPSSNEENNQSKDKDHYHTWSSSRPHTPRSRPSLGEVVLTGGTLIEVPEGYVIPKPPKPTRSVRLLVPGEDKPIILDKNDTRTDKPPITYTSPPTSPGDSKSFSSLPPIAIPPKRDEGKSQITHLITPEMDENRIVISTGMAV